MNTNPFMKKSKIIFSTLILSTLVLANLNFVAFAQSAEEISDTTITDEAINETVFTAVITSVNSIEINKNIIFDASKTLHPDSQKELKYKWDFGDGNKKEGVEVVHNYTTLGQKTVSLEVFDGSETSTITKEIFVHQKIIMFITDQVNLKERIEGFKNYARDRDVEVIMIESYESATEFISGEILGRKLSEEIANLKRIDAIVVWTNGDAGMNALSSIKQQQDSSGEATLTFDNKTILVLTHGDTKVGQIQRQYELLKPKNIVIAKEAAIYPFIDSPDNETFLLRMKDDGYEYSLANASTGKLQLWNFMSYFVNYLVDSGIPANTVVLILLLPIIATIVAFMKQVVGLTTFGVYTPSIITLSFWILGLKFGITMILMIFLVGAAMRYLLKQYRLLYIPKMAIVFSAVSLIVLAMLIISIRFKLFDAQFFSLSIFPMLILATLTEKFVNIQSNKGFLRALVLSLETVFVSIIAYLAIDALKGFILIYPEIILATIFINIFLGRWTGLRIVEYVRFRDVLRHVEEE
ncbi:PKD domain-containing protein [Patescibacteria group bacterium]|nr:PKD domain-containing protein [Patescibacteria group bacterium]